MQENEMEVRLKNQMKLIEENEMEIDKESKQPRLPQKGEYVRYHGMLVDVRTIQPPTPAPYQEYIFEEVFARTELRYRDGQVMDTLGTLTDFYGPGTAEETAIKELKEFIEHKGIGAESDIEAVVVREVYEKKAIQRSEPNLYDKTFFDFRFVSSNLKSETDVWSSRK